MSKTTNRYTNFLDWVESQGQDKSNFSTFLWLINAHHSLCYLPNICEHLNDAFDFFSIKLELEDNLSDLNLIKNCLIYIEENLGLLLKRFDTLLVLQDTDIKTRKNPLRRTCFTRQSCYASWLNTHINDEDSNDFFRCIQLHAFIASTKIMKSYSSINGYEKNNQFESNALSILGKNNHRVDAAWRYVRDLSEEEGIREIFEDEGIEIDKPTADLYIDLWEIKKNLDSEEYPDFIRYLFPLFELAFDDIDFRGRNVGSSIRRYAPRQMHDGHIQYTTALIEEIISIPMDDDSVNPKLSVLKSFGKNDKKRKLWMDLDLDPEENDDQDEMYFNDFGCSDSSKSNTASYLSAKGIVRHASMYNQLLPNNKNMISDYELSILINKCIKTIEKENSTSKKETAILILIMLWTGSDLDTASKIAWVNTTDERDGRTLSYLGHKNYWKLKPFTVKYKKSFSNESTKYSKTLQKYIFLKDTFNIGHYLEKTFSKKILEINNYEEEKKEGNESQIISKRLFPRKRLKARRADVNNFLYELPRELNITIHKIENYLFQLLAIEGSGDIADAMFLTGRYHASGKTLLHYTTPYVDNIAKQYENVTYNKAQDIYELLGGKAPELPIELELSGNPSIGNNLCPTFDSVKQMFESIRLDLKQMLKTYEKASIIKYHNRYSFYTNQVIAYATGFRAITDPSFSSNQIDSETGFTVISDKDGEDFYNSRLVWVPQQVQEQIKCYEEHLEFITPYIFHNQHSHFKDNNKEQVTPAVFFLDEKFNIENIKPSTCKRFLDKYLPLPLNVNRRFLRNQLKERNCPPEIINAFMGHWAMGQEPWGQFSSLSTAHLFNFLKKYISEIITDLTCLPLHSQLAELS